MQNRKFQNRRGITLLFVVSMIVLFLLMGTTFVVVASGFLRDSKKRKLHDIHTIDRTAYLDQAFYDLVRGPELTNTTSPLRGQDLLSDEYGYGFKAFVSDAQVPVFVASSGSQLFKISVISGHSINGPFPRNPNEAWDLRDTSLTAPEPLVESQGIYNGLVLSFVSGSAKGISTRIVNHEIDGSGFHWFWLSVTEWTDQSGTLSLASLIDSEFVVNGREFSGTGAGVYTPSQTAPTLGSTALDPNQVGENLTTLLTTYLTSNRSPNESYDAADFQNMFLAGIDSGGTLIPSFHRDKLVAGNTAAGGIANRQSFSAFNNAPVVVDTNNDGNPDAIWIDSGMSVQTNNDGTYYKPLVAYTVVDLDGRLNLNAHGNFGQVQSQNNYIDASAPVTMMDGTVLPRGQGMGPAEISLAGLFNATEFTSLLTSRYGSDGVPGDGGIAGRSRARLFGHPYDFVNWTASQYGTVGNLFASSPMDLLGRFAIGTPAEAFVDSNASNLNDRFVDNNIAGFPNSMPVVDMLASTFTNREFSNSPYEMSYAPSPFNDSYDAPFTPWEFERVLRPFDVDSNLLPIRLWNAPSAGYWSTNTAAKDLVTTASFEVPITFEVLRAKLRFRVATENSLNLSIPVEEAMVENIINTNPRLFAPELSRGLKMNVNRALGNGYDGADNDLVVDNPGEESTEANTDQGGALMDLNNDTVANNATDADARIDFAKQLYMLALLVTDQVDVDEDGDGTADVNGYQKAVAQWAINVVDFRDPDSIMTRFDYDPMPWDLSGWAPSGTDFVWGCERPELLLTETMAAHPRRTEDLSSDSSGGSHAITDGDLHFDQRLRPEPFAFIELYNPWTQNSLNQQFDTSLYDVTNQGVLLDQRSLTANGATSPVWRISIDRPDRGAVNPNNNTTPVRYVYFADPDDGATNTVGDDDAANVEVFYSSFSAVPLRPGAQAIVGSLGIEDPSNAGQYRSFLGRRSGKTVADEAANNLELDTTRHLTIEPSAGEVTRYPVDPTYDPRYSVILPIDTARTGTPGSPAAPRSFTVSDAFGGYPDVDFMGTPYIAVPDGSRYVVPWDVPFDDVSKTDANRNVDDLNDILTDEGMAKEFRFIRLQRLANPLNPWDANTNPYITIDTMEMDLIAFNGVTSDTDPTVIAPDQANAAIALERGAQDTGAANRRRQLWGSTRPASISAGVAGMADHYFDVELVESLAKTNDAYTDPAANGFGFPWLTWNNRPYVSHLELTNVPFTSPDKLTQRFTIDDDTVTQVINPYEGIDTSAPAAKRLQVNGQFGHLINFFGNDDDSSVAQPDFYRLMDFLEVPSRFLGTESDLNSVGNFVENPYNFLSRYRVPGKINLNTIYNNPGDPANSTIWEALMGQYASSANGCTWAEFRDSRQGSTTGRTDFHNPFRPAGTGNYVPGTGVDVVLGPDCTLFREGAVTGEPLFDFMSNSPTNQTDRSAYFRNSMRQRLGNLVTTRSSVFAIWITVGYFEVDENGTLANIAGGGNEIGTETGEVVRNRGFYIFDRSIPMAFEPGKNHNVERGILVQSIIE